METENERDPVFRVISYHGINIKKNPPETRGDLKILD